MVTDAERLAKLETLVETQGREISKLRNEREGMMKRGFGLLLLLLGSGSLYIWKTHLG